MPQNQDDEKLSKQELRESAKRGVAFANIQSHPDWQAVADIFFKLTDHWKKQLIKFREGDTLDTIAIDRIRWTSMISGLEVFFRTMQDDMETAKEFDKKRDDEEEPIRAPKINRTRDLNPFRTKNQEEEQ